MLMVRFYRYMAQYILLDLFATNFVYKWFCSLFVWIWHHTECFWSEDTYVRFISGITTDKPRVNHLGGCDSLFYWDYDRERIEHKVECMTGVCALEKQWWNVSELSINFLTWHMIIQSSESQFLPYS